MTFINRVVYHPSTETPEQGGFFSVMDDAADVCFAPLRWLGSCSFSSIGLVYQISYDKDSSTGEFKMPNQGSFQKEEISTVCKAIRVFLGIVFVIPGFVLGSMCRGIAFLNREIRYKHLFAGDFSNRSYASQLAKILAIRLKKESYPKDAYARFVNLETEKSKYADLVIESASIVKVELSKDEQPLHPHESIVSLPEQFSTFIHVGVNLEILDEGVLKACKIDLITKQEGQINVKIREKLKDSKVITIFQRKFISRAVFVKNAAFKCDPNWLMRLKVVLLLPTTLIALVVRPIFHAAMFVLNIFLIQPFKLLDGRTDCYSAGKEIRRSFEDIFRSFCFGSIMLFSTLKILFSPVEGTMNYHHAIRRLNRNEAESNALFLSKFDHLFYDEHNILSNQKIFFLEESTPINDLQIENPEEGKV